MRTTMRSVCPECGFKKPPDWDMCPHCRRFVSAPIVVHRVTHESPLKNLLIGAALAPVFLLTPMLEFMGWFLTSLVHETGHCIAGWLAGCPSFPAISLAGHAMASHSAQSTALCFVIWAGIGYLAWNLRAHKGLCITLVAAALFYPLAVFTGLRDFLFLIGGHATELAFAAIFFWRAIVGGFTDSRAERITYATCAWYLLASNIWLAGGLLFSDRIVAWYHGSGSFGLTNDYIRLARDVMGVGLGVVAFLMLIASLAVLPVTWLLARRR